MRAAPLGAGCATYIAKNPYANSAYGASRNYGAHGNLGRAGLAYRDFPRCLMETYYRVLNTGVLESVTTKVASSVRVWGGESIGGEST